VDNIRRIGVVTVTYNSAKVLPQFLQSVLAQTFRDFLLYIVDNGSKDESLELIYEHVDSRIRVIPNVQNLGVAEGNNQGIRAALADHCDAVLLLNNDTEFPYDLFAKLCSGLQEFQADMTTAKMLYFRPSDVIWCAGGWLDPRRFFGAFHYGMGQPDNGQYDQPRRVTYAPTCCLLIDRSVFDRVGLMDSRYFVYADDVDFLYRCFQQDLAVWYDPRAIIYHKVSALTGGDDSEFAIRYMTRNRVYFLRKHLPMWRVILWSLHFLAITAPRRLVARRDSVRIWWLRCRSFVEGWRLEVPRSAAAANRR
jgi:GT2 family glycosyltransferase